MSRCPLAPLTTLGVGGPARWFVTAPTPTTSGPPQLVPRRGVPLLVLGGGSNLVVADDGFDGLVLQVAIARLACRHAGDRLLARGGAGEPWDAVVAPAGGRRAGPALECLSGIPGTVGGTPIQNVGAYGQEVASIIEAVHGVRPRAPASWWSWHAARRAGSPTGTSRFKESDAGRFVVCDVRFRLTPGRRR